MRERRIDWPLHAVLIWIQVTFGASHVFAKYVLGYMSPNAVAGIRVLIATPLLLLMAWRVDRRWPARGDWPILAALGFLGIFANQLLFINGLKYTTATNAAILMPSIPVFTALIAVVFRVERMRFIQALGVAVAVGGALVMVNPLHFSDADGTLLGNLMILANCLAYSGYLVLQRPLLRRLPPLTVVAWSFVFGGAGILAFTWREVAFVEYGAMPGLVWIGLAYMILIQTALNYALNMWAMDRSVPSLVSAYKTLQPVSASVLAAIFLHESLGWAEAIGFGLIIGGLMLVTSREPAAAVVADGRG